ncbi:MAG: OB-fold nucleic acid binding domain-containing protein [bacterium]|nr:OB-fold nucleic acid binding domain-containing protein [bacterium]
MVQDSVSIPLKRQTAYKIWLKEVHLAESKVDENSGFPYFSIAGKHIVRVNVIGSVIGSFYSGGYGSLIIDDGSAQVRVKVWGDDLSLIEGKNIGDFILVVGRLADYQDERYIRPEIIRSIHLDWALLRRLELIKEYGVPTKEEKVVLVKENSSVPEVEPSLAARERILNTIEKHEEVAEDILVEECKMSKDKVMVALYDLLKEGEIFSPKKGFYRLV